jgi:drug/metabolite transporter (DMT)-like permease
VEDDPPEAERVTAKQANVPLGIALAVGGFGCMTVMDGFAKAIDGAWPGTAISALRFLVQTALLAPLIWWREGAVVWTTPRMGLQLARAAALSGASVVFFTAVMLMPLADATAVGFLNALLVPVLAAIFLKERVRPGIFVATVVAFAGVLIVLQPNVLALGWPALLPLVSALCFSTYMILNRLSAGLAPALSMQLIGGTLCCAMIAAAALALHLTGIPAFHVSTPSAVTLLKVLAMGLFGTTGHVLLFMAAERAPAPMISPMIYTQIVLAVVIGYTVFADPLTVTTAAGVLLIVGCGLYVWRVSTEERRRDLGSDA